MDDHLADPVRAGEPAAALVRVRPGAVAADEPLRHAHDTVVDPSVLDALTEQLGHAGPEFRATLLTTWHDQAAVRLGELEAAVAAEDADAVARIAHALKSGSAALGAAPLAAGCDEIEARLRTGGTADLAADADTIRTHVERASAAFTALW